MSNAAGLPVTPADSNAASEMEHDDRAANTLSDSYWAKYNVKVEKPQYTNEQYESHLKSEDWSKEETDYLVNLAVDFDLRWMVIADRFEYQPKENPKENEDSMAVTLQARPRTQEDMKARYYDLAAKTMVLHNPLSSMSTTEFDAYEKMIKYEPGRETQRKKYAEQLMNRTDEEKYEEEMLLKELSRIVHNQEKLFNERKALHDRLKAPENLARDTYSTAIYQSSQGLTQLMQNLITQNKNKELERRGGDKRRSGIGGEGDFAAGALGQMDRNQRHSLTSGTDKKNPPGGTGHRQLSTREEVKFGVSHPNERLTGCIQFRHERVTKAGQAKSGVQTSRIGAALTELKIPPRLVMPTAKVVTEYEKLVEHIKTLLEVRKLSEKLDGEIKTWLAQKEQQEAKDRGEEVKEEELSQVAQDEDSPKVDTTRNEDESKMEVDNENEEEEEEKDEEKADSDDEANHIEDADQDSSDDEDNENVVVDKGGEQEDEEDTEANQIGAQDDAYDGEEQGRQQQDEEQNDDSDDDDDDGDNNEDNADSEQDDAGGQNDDDSSGSSRASPTHTSRSEGLRKRSASVMSYVSNKSSKRQRK